MKRLPAVVFSRKTTWETVKTDLLKPKEYNGGIDMNLTERYMNVGPLIRLISVVPKRALYESGRKKPLDIFKLESIIVERLDKSAINYKLRLEDDYLNLKLLSKIKPPGRPKNII